MPERRESIDVAGLAMDAFVADPDGAGPHPGIVVIMHAPGLDAYTEEMARRLAGEGYAAIAPQLYHRQDLTTDETGLERMARLHDEELIADVGACVGYLQGRSDVTDDIGIIGFCMGGRITFLAATANPAFRAAVPFYGGHMDMAWGDGPTVIDRLPGIGCPVLALFGGLDGNPSPEMMRRLDAELTRLGKEHEFRAYPDADHGYMNFTNPDRYKEAVAAESWELTLEFLAARLGGNAT